jgi:replicative DNA helicase
MRNLPLESPPPQNLDAEQAVLGAVMIEPGMLPVITGIVDVKDFYAPHHGAIFGTVCRLHARGIPVDKISVATALRESKVLDAVGGVEYLSMLLNAVATTATASYYAEVVAEASMQRYLMRTGMDVVKAGMERQSSLQIAGIMEAALEHARTHSVADDGIPFQEALVEAAASRPERSRNGIPYGFASLDKNLRGMKPGQNTVVAARTSHGKSVMAEMLAVNAARRAPVLFFPLEMGRLETVDRIAHRLQIRANMGDAKPFEGIDMRIYDNRHPRSVARIGAEIAKHKPAVVVVDHLQWLLDWDEQLSRNERSDAAPKRTVKRLCRLTTELHTHIVMVHQVNREADGKPPRLSHLRETGAVEDWAWTVMLLHRKHFENQPEDNVIEVIVAKARGGKPGKKTMAWDGPNQSIYDLPGANKEGDELEPIPPDEVRDPAYDEELGKF